MDKIGSIEIRVIGNKGSLTLSPDNYDIKEIALILQNIEDLLFPNNKKDRPIITYDIEEGSVRNIFKTSLQAIIGFSAVITQIEKVNSIDFLDLKTAQAIENIQSLSYQKNYDFEIKTSVSEDTALKITPNTKFFRTENIWIDAELYFYGTLTNAGGKTKANIHLDTDEFGSLTIEAPKVYLQNQEENLLYKKFGVRATGKQNLETGEIDKSSLKLLQLIDFSPKYDDQYLDTLITKAKSNWKDINANDWLNNIRGGYDA
ncbi:hypothetical protein [Rufibacter quisquiliarum]|uniref:Uncharacterized protein n=1 Tax=Rufibacter quisquiliarum TaxID=1549639 RepID=A0A839GQ48_9BACT|nr:hypothetical protein [Rufibacter quisquiliarum]MBA9077645.1 hypothetical protein [Rufibacter quisquiliarum]